MATSKIETLVKVEEDGSVELNQPEKDRKILLSRDAWERLCTYRDELTKALKNKQGVEWILDEEKNIRVHTSSFNDQMYLHIRQWWKRGPCKMDVSMRILEWEEASQLMIASQELTMGIAVMVQLMVQKVKDFIRQSCEGCIRDKPSQTSHECLMKGGVMAELGVKEVEVPPSADFILCLAQEVCKCNLILENPHDTYNAIRRMHWLQVECDVIEQCIMSEPR